MKTTFPITIATLIALLVPVRAGANVYEDRLKEAFDDIISAVSFPFSDKDVSQMHTIYSDPETGVKEGQLDVYKFTIGSEDMALINNAKKAYEQLNGNSNADVYTLWWNDNDDGSFQGYRLYYSPEQTIVVGLACDHCYTVGFIAPDDVTFDYLKGREYAPKGEDWDKAVAYWRTLRSDDDAVFDKEVAFDASDIIPYVSYGTNPGMAIGITECVPRLEEIEEKARPSFLKALDYMGMHPGDPLVGLGIDYVFLGACTNGRIEDFRAFASVVKGHKKADRVTALLVPGSWAVARQIHEEGIDRILEEAGFEIRQPGCSACLAMNDDKIPPGKYCVSTSNRNFEGRQGPGSRTILASPLTAAAAAIHGVVYDPRDVI